MTTRFELKILSFLESVLTGYYLLVLSNSEIVVPSVCIPIYSVCLFWAMASNNRLQMYVHRRRLIHNCLPQTACLR
ncbi:hypothetical protein DFH08DRAFT_843300 [Mycena albidolilacea]|uniref:Uncharacterized protein n=1 Tax=Mycena albidolilacea TaxID=1033008 RepID=A0AAD7F056_9AGAR|nr:hypothetical protein DFH08DRAFT_843300 [Mycena albidolilacea]